MFISLFFLRVGVRKPAKRPALGKTVWERKELVMNVYAYAGLTYLFTALISFALIGTIVLLNKALGGKAEEGEDHG